MGTNTLVNGRLAKCTVEEHIHLRAEANTLANFMKGGRRQWPDIYANRDKFRAEWKNGKRNGQGTFTFASGDKYVGAYRDDKRNGQGTFTFASGDKYVGEYKDGKRNGQGTLTFAMATNMKVNSKIIN